MDAHAYAPGETIFSSGIGGTLVKLPVEITHLRRNNGALTCAETHIGAQS
jgi:ribosomal protein S7